MYKLISAFTLVALFFLFNISHSIASSGDIVISEILFDPVGTDTGLEYIVLKNIGSSSVNISSWDLYADSAGYFTFPDFVLDAGKTVKVLLRATGTSNSDTLYDSSATGNIGNSSGSIALFSSTTHGKDNIVAFMRYHKPGSTERKTWETSAASAGLWTAGLFVDITQQQEGQILSLDDVNKKTAPDGWSLMSPTSATEQAPDIQSGESDTGVDPDLPSSAYQNIPPAQKIKAYAGNDITILAGAVASFHGYAEDPKGEQMDGARFLWNFGDGSTGEGKGVAHAFRFPGVYTVYMDSSAGIYSASDILKVTVIESPIVVSEIKPGNQGWVELKNNSARSVDISGFGIVSEENKPFYMPPNTIFSPWSEIVFGSEILRFNIVVGGNISLLYPNGFSLLKISYPNIFVGDSESINFINGEWRVGSMTPGEKNISKSLSQTVSKNKDSSDITNVSDKNTNNTAPAPTASSRGNISNKITGQDTTKQDLSASLGDLSPTSSNNGIYWWLFGGIGAGIVGGLIFLALKKYIFVS